LRILVIADIHSNITALKAVISDVEHHSKIDDIWCLGDIVGYGPDPSECIRFMRENCRVCVAGNHDLAAVNTIDISDFNPDAANAILWTRHQLNSEDSSYLANLPLSIKKKEFTIVHGSPRDPLREYLSSTNAALENLLTYKTKYCLVGHTHEPIMFFIRDNEIQVKELKNGDTIFLDKTRLILNPGAIGQSRDGDPRASYGIIDCTRHIFTQRRVAYDIEEVKKRMKENGFTNNLIDRLSSGR
jgi:predicted phosphodiesterase